MARQPSGHFHNSNTSSGIISIERTRIKWLTICQYPPTGKTFPALPSVRAFFSLSSNLIAMAGRDLCLYLLLFSKQSAKSKVLNIQSALYHELYLKNLNMIYQIIS